MRIAGAFFSILSVLFISRSGLAQERPVKPPVTVILCAFDAEAAVLSDAITNGRDNTFEGMKFTTGELRGRAVVLGKTGIGKVNAAMTTTTAILEFHPNEVLFSGIAGGLSPDLRPGDIVIGASVAQHDHGLLGPDGFRSTPTDSYLGGKNPLFFTPDERLLKCTTVVAGKITLESVPGRAGNRVPSVANGVIVTGDTFIASSAKKAELVESFKADAVEMEGGAVAQVCHQLKAPCIIIRSISDNADENASTDLQQFYKTAAANAARFVIELVEALK
jgi:adenosylhomocysteine nucleosidase